MGYRPVRRFGIRYSSSASSTTSSGDPPLISKFRQDLKTAMRAKDTPRLNVLRAVLAEYTNASKTKSPIRTDLEMWTLLKKRQQSSQEAIKEAEEQKRDDLVQKARGDIEIVEEYAQQVDRMSESDIRAVLQQLIEDLSARETDGKVNIQQIIKEAFKEGGPFEGKLVQRDWVIKEAIPMLKAM